jgi:hypothetical protein
MVIYPLTCERLQNGKFHILHIQIEGYLRKFFEFYQMLGLLFNTSLSLEFSILKHIFETAHETGFCQIR